AFLARERATPPRAVPPTPVSSGAAKADESHRDTADRTRCRRPKRANVAPCARRAQQMPEEYPLEFSSIDSVPSQYLDYIKICIGRYLVQPVHKEGVNMRSILRVLFAPLVVVAGCTSEGPIEQTSTNYDALTAVNGVSMNGVSMNGTAVNGVSMNGVSMNGVS